MSLIVTTTKVREKSGLTGTAYDTKINNLIADWVPTIEHALSPEHLDNTGDTRLQATLNLGATELVSGELLAQIGREPGASEGLKFGWLEVKPAMTNLADPYGLKAQGAQRLRPYLKHTDRLQGSLGVLAGGDRTPGEDQ